MHVSIDETGQQGDVAQVDTSCARRHSHARLRPDADDAIVRHDHDGIRDRRRTGAIDARMSGILLSKEPLTTKDTKADIHSEFMSL